MRKRKAKLKGRGAASPDVAHTQQRGAQRRDSADVGKGEIASGTLHVHPRGFAFLVPQDRVAFPDDIFVPKHLTQNAVDGDIVEVLVNSAAVSEKGPEGRVTTIVSRARTHLAGIIRSLQKDGDALAYVPLLGTSQRVLVQSDGDVPVHVGDRVILEVIDWGSKETETLCRFSHHTGHISDPSCDVKAAIEEYELRSDFPSEVIEEAKKFGNQVSRNDIAKREDLRKFTCFTIDPETAKDFDDALSISKGKNGHFHLGVHIADVSHYVRPGSALDIEAQKRCNSTYFPGYCLPMLPPDLSDNLCSLKANVNRLTVSVLMEINAEGELINHRICRSVIKSSKRFTYEEAKEVLDGKKKNPHAKALKLMVALCHLLKKKRYERGSIDFALPDFVVRVDNEGNPQAIEKVPYDITHQLVEEFMLKANEVIALHLNRQGKDLAYRIHEEPAEEDIREFASLVNAFGFPLPDKPTPWEIQKVFDKVLATPHGQYLAISYIRRMRMAVYSPDNIGHYGLGLSHYCHFTSPIRRYIDLVVHRILLGEYDDWDSLEIIAHTCSEQERISAKAENHVSLLKKLRLLKKDQSQHPYKQYEAIITKIKNFGIFFETVEWMIEGLLRLSELENDYFVYEEHKMRLRGIHTGKTYCLGDPITVSLKEANLITLETSWYLIPEKTTPPRKKKKQPERKPLKPSKKRKKRSHQPRVSHKGAKKSKDRKES